MKSQVQIFDDFLSIEDLDNIQHLFFKNTNFPYFFFVNPVFSLSY